MAIDRSELRLIWPPAIFAAEARALVAAGADDDALGGLLAEAFHGGRGEQVLRQVARDHPHGLGTLRQDGPLGTRYVHEIVDPGLPSRATALLVTTLADDAHGLPRYVRRPLYRERQNPSTPKMLEVAEVKDRFARLVGELCELGYFEDAFGSRCDDAHDNPDALGQQMLAERLGLDEPMWPLLGWRDGARGQTEVHAVWSMEVFFDVIEALDELVARPRVRWWHDFHREWDYGDYASAPGQEVYRWRVNEVLDASVVPFRLAVGGSDAGLLVHAVGDSRDELLELAYLALTETERDEVAHAVVSFRARNTTREAKRSAVVTLAGIFEARRDLLKGKLKKDEGDLFNLANNFALRHRDARQHGDYDEAYLDWIFWWYLATIELTDRLLAQDAAGTS